MHGTCNTLCSAENGAELVEKSVLENGLSHWLKKSVLENGLQSLAEKISPWKWAQSLAEKSVLENGLSHWLKNQSLKMGSVITKLGTKCFSWNVARFVRMVFICWAFQEHLLNFLSQWGSLFIHLLPNVCMYVCVCLFVTRKAPSVLIQITPNLHKRSVIAWDG